MSSEEIHLGLAYCQQIKRQDDASTPDTSPLVQHYITP
jgi:hypothetical protein